MATRNRKPGLSVKHGDFREVPKFCGVQVVDLTHRRQRSGKAPAAEDGLKDSASKTRRNAAKTRKTGDFNAKITRR
jgi:hypothetical protein